MPSPLQVKNSVEKISSWWCVLEHMRFLKNNNLQFLFFLNTWTISIDGEKVQRTKGKNLVKTFFHNLQLSGHVFSFVFKHMDNFHRKGR